MREIYYFFKKQSFKCLGFKETVKEKKIGAILFTNGY